MRAEYPYTTPLNATLVALRSKFGHFTEGFGLQTKNLGWGIEIDWISYPLGCEAGEKPITGHLCCVENQYITVWVTALLDYLRELRRMEKDKAA